MSKLKCGIFMAVAMVAGLVSFPRPQAKGTNCETNEIKTATQPQIPQENETFGKMTAGRYNLGICGQTRGSGAWLREWIELQILSGVDHLWLVNDNTNETHDGSEAIMKYYEKTGFLTIIPGKMPLHHPGCEMVIPTQNWKHNCIAPKYCAEKMGHLVNWLIFADTDEFIFPHTGCDLSSFVTNNCDPLQSHVTIRWERFGTNGFNYHPAGLMSENFLASGGNCAHVNTGKYSRLPMCRNQPFNFCIECRHMKVMFNTKNCLTPDHFGMVHWPVNTTEWKKNPRLSKFWKHSSGKGSNFKNDECKLTPWSDDTKQCSRWLYSGGGSKNPVQYSKNCCAAGIGYNHYGSKSLQYYMRKTQRKQTDLRGFRTDLSVIDMSGIISYSILRFVRALRTRFMKLGLPVSANARFADFNSTRGTGSAFIETNFKYSHMEGLGTKLQPVTTMVPTPVACAVRCHEIPSCSAFTYKMADAKCTLVIPPEYATVNGKSLGRKQWPRTHIPATREWDFSYASGVIMRDAECPVRQLPHM
eukprot:TRINITY_DN37233_c0_g1_i1.p1 TRINITY_DN37233_c0_g1~~TRINITY_DN37233_c0_g1_i1.p1  ORF type:complete len:529 (+),score=54.08 TRINITY_DN37233_c0_g1_i1:45-1631(+)